MSAPYSRAVDPPFPALAIQLHLQSTGQSTGTFVALMDTGADASIMPMNHLMRIGAQERSPAWLRGITGERMQVGLYFVDIRVGDITLPGVRVVGASALDEALLGRDVLNRLAVLLDGPALQATVVDDADAARFRGRS